MVLSNWLSELWTNKELFWGEDMRNFFFCWWFGMLEKTGKKEPGLMISWSGFEMWREEGLGKLLLWLVVDGLMSVCRVS